LAAALIASHERALEATGESWPLRQVIRAQQSAPALFQRQYWSANSISAYKFQAMNENQPKILVLGSTRMGGLRAEMFAPSGQQFYNGAGLIRNLSDLQAVLDRTPASATPPLVIVGLDLWWFSYHWPMGSIDWNEDPDGNWMARSSTIARLALKPWTLFASPRTAPYPLIGLAAMRSGEGFRSDGSIAFAPDESSSTLSAHPGASVLERVESGSGEFTPNPALSRERLQRLALVLRQFRERGALVAGIAPPFSIKVVDRLTIHPVHRQFWQDFRIETARTFRNAGFPFLDASDPRQLNLDDTYLLDGSQAGEVFWLAVLDHFGADPRIKAQLPQLSATAAALIPTGSHTRIAPHR
jgi:hypothetical protein